MRYTIAPDSWISYLLDEPEGAELYLAPVTCGGGAATKAELPGFRFRFKRFLSRADKAPKSSEIDGAGDETEGVTERVGGRSSCLIGSSAGQVCMGEIGSGFVSDFTASSISTSPSASASANSLSRSISSPTLSRKSKPRRPIASLRAFLTSAALERIPAGFTNSFPDEAKSSFPCNTRSCTEKLGNGGTGKDSSRVFCIVLTSSDGFQRGTMVKMWDNATDAAVRVSKDFEWRKGIIYIYSRIKDKTKCDMDVLELRLTSTPPTLKDPQERHAVDLT